MTTSCKSILFTITLLLLLFFLHDCSSTRYREEEHEVVSPRLMAQLVDVEATLEHVTIEHVVLSFFSLAERRRSFEIEFWIVFMSSFSDDERRFFFSFLDAE